MSNPKCPVCGHVNLVGAALCEMCDTRLSEPPGAGAGGPFTAAGEGPGAPSADFGARYDDFDPEAGARRAGALPTDVPSPQFKGAGDVISPTLAVYRKHFLLVGLLVAVTTLPVALLRYVTLQAMTEGSPVEIADGSLVNYALSVQAVAWLLSFVGSALLSGALVYAVIEIQRAGGASAGEALRRGLRLLPKVFTVTLLYTVITTVGYLLLVIPGVVFSLMYAVAVPVAVAENLRPFEALKRSAWLTEGYKGLIFLTQFLWGVLVLVVTAITTGSLVFGDAVDTLPAMLVQALVGGMLESSAHVLSVYIFLGLLNERRQGFEAGAFTPAPAAR